MMDNDVTVPNFEDILEAARRIEDKAWRTPVMQNPAFNALTGSSVFLKCENFQRTGAFKFRGAFNAVSKLSADQRRRGVITHSSGNHGQAIARVGSMLDTATTIVMPTNAPAIKRAAAISYGAKIVDYDPLAQKREAVSATIAAEQGLTLIPPFDHADVIAGQGTATLELFQDVDALDVLLVPCGGGGLLSGAALAAKALCPRCLVVGVEPELGDDAARSFRSGRLQRVENPQTIADGTRTESLGDITFAVIRANVDDIITVSEAAIVDAVRFAFLRMKIVIEPSGALGIAAMMSDAWTQVQSRVNTPNARVGIIVSGGNIDDVTAATILGGAD